MSVKTSSSGSVEKYLSRADECLAILEAAALKVDMGVVVRTIVCGLYPNFLLMAAPMLYAGIVTTVPNLRDGFESLTIIGTTPRALVQFWNAASQPPANDDIHNNKDYHKCRITGHIARNCLWSSWWQRTVV